MYTSPKELGWKSFSVWNEKQFSQRSLGHETFNTVVYESNEIHIIMRKIGINWSFGNKLFFLISSDSYHKKDVVRITEYSFKSHTCLLENNFGTVWCILYAASCYTGQNLLVMMSNIHSLAHVFKNFILGQTGKYIQQHLLRWLYCWSQNFKYFFSSFLNL